MNESLLEVLLSKAKGYTIEEVTSEYVIEPDGTKRLVKEKVQTKHYPPDNTALKSYMEYCGGEGKYDSYTDEQLETERIRLIAQLKNKEAK